MSQRAPGYLWCIAHCRRLVGQRQKTFKCDFVQVYGLTETTGCATHLPATDHAQERGKLRPAANNTGVEIKIVDENDREVSVGQVGEILIKAASNMKGYWNNPDATNGAVKDGWFIPAMPAMPMMRVIFSFMTA